MIIGFIGGFLPIAALVPFADQDGAGWLLLGVLQMGGASAFVGGIVGIITGTIGGTQAVLRAAVTKDVPAILIGAAIGFIAGFLVAGYSALSSVEARSVGPFVEASAVCAFYGGDLGFIVGTIVGTWQAARKQK
jgi:hypothetical protein